MGKAAEKKKTTRMTDIKPLFLSLVDYGANWGGKDHLPALKSALEKSVPADDATPEEKQKAHAARAKQYGIEALTTGAALSYPAGDPTSEAMYGDPVNLKYPIGGEGNAADVERIRNALARFKGNADTYSQDASKARVYERIVRAALAAEIAVSYDPNDAIDKLLPADLKTRLETASKDADEAAKKQAEENAKKAASEVTAKAADILSRVQALELASRVEAITKRVVVPASVAPPSVDTVALAKEREELKQAKLEIIRLQADASRRGVVGGTLSGEVPGERSEKSEKTVFPMDYVPRRA
jgi:hypothetical protein